MLLEPPYTWPPSCAQLATIQSEGPAKLLGGVGLKVTFLLLVLDQDKGLAYLSALLGFLVVSRYASLYSQRVAARTAIGAPQGTPNQL